MSAPTEAASVNRVRIVLIPHLGRMRTYRTLNGARRAARKMLGPEVRLDPDGYAVGRHGACMSFEGATFAELFGEEPTP